MKRLGDGESGFTIIEVILFLAITGGMFVALIVGVNGSLNRQHYADTVAALKTTLVAQYEAVIHPRNDRDSNWSCTASGVAPAPGGGGSQRGTSACVLLGRYAQIKADGTAVETGDVIGIEPTNAASLTNDSVALLAYQPRRSPINVETSDIGWQSTIRTPDGQVSSASFVILRSPVSGLVRAFAQSQPLPTSDLTPVLTDQAATTAIKLCMDGSGRPVQSVTLAPAVASSTGVVLNENDSECHV